MYKINKDDNELIVGNTTIKLSFITKLPKDKFITFVAKEKYKIDVPTAEAIYNDLNPTVKVSKKPE